MCKKSVSLVVFVLAVGVCGTAWADVSVPTMFTDHAVLQRGMRVPVWGTASVSEQVTVDFAGQSKSDIADAEGAWMVMLDAMAASSAPSNMVITGNNVITITGVQVGEVWLCSGQSNMLFALNAAIGGVEAATEAGNYNIRFFEIEDTPDDTIWTICTEETAANFSAVGYFFGRELAENLENVPIGLIQAAVGGTDLVEWTHAMGGDADGAHYDEKIVPIQPYAIKGVNWYQGENDAFFNPVGYYYRLVGLINEWRSDWGQGDFAFQIVQLHWKSDDETGWAYVRNDELGAYLTMTNTGFATASDLPPDGGHPPTKEPVGVRLGMSARALQYGETDLVWSGPIPDYDTCYIDGSEIVVTFNHIGSGLTTKDSNTPNPFKVAGINGIYYDTSAQISGDTVVVSSASVSEPAAVRYMWDYHQGNLSNLDGMPAVPFRIERWHTGSLLWSEGFEDVEFCFAEWVSDENASVSRFAAYEGDNGLKLAGTTSAEKAISTEGFTNIHIKFTRKQVAFDSSEYIYAEWYDGTDWNELEASQDSSWGTVDIYCGSGADDSADFKIRFRTNANKTNEYSCIDNVAVCGTAN
ncbi:MAG: sialate O-acetylesterase [Sedimentisphaerales bacterium]|nr:sialate O-acetylesterase [Sedimentisphaerales bacterium]